jgi:hypothetical protein
MPPGKSFVRTCRSQSPAIDPGSEENTLRLQKCSLPRPKKYLTPSLEVLSPD